MGRLIRDRVPLLLVLICVAAVALPVAADGVKTTPAPQSAPPASDATKVICTKERTTGSMIPVKRCRTVQQIHEEQKSSAAYLRSLNDAQTGRMTSDHPGMGSAQQ